jgi:formyltetrahydrofolate deformylase
MSDGDTVVVERRPPAAPGPAAEKTGFKPLGAETKAPSFVLVTSCPDTTGIVAAVSGFLASNNCLITEAQHFDDPFTNTSFMRTVFHDNGKGVLPIDELDVAFALKVGAPFQMQWRFHEVRNRCRTVIAVSKSGHCLNSMLHRWSTGVLPIEISAVVSNHQELRSLAEWHGVPFYYLPVSEGRKAEQEKRIMDVFEKTDAELLVLARYMQILTPEACGYFTGRAINIHHSFLPGFKGANAYHQAHARGVKLIGATAHYVTTDLDEGPIVEQEVARVDHSMTPEELVDIGSDLETVVLNRAVRWHAERRLFINGNKTVVLR